MEDALNIELVGRELTWGQTDAQTRWNIKCKSTALMVAYGGVYI